MLLVEPCSSLWLIKVSLQHACDPLPPAWEGLRGDNILSETLFLILPHTLAQIRLRAAQISSENLWRDLRCPSASLKVFVLQIQYKGACRHLDPCCAADAAQGHTNPPCDIQQHTHTQKKNHAVKLLQHSANQQLPQFLTKGRSVYFFLFVIFFSFFFWLRRFLLQEIIQDFWCVWWQGHFLIRTHVKNKAKWLQNSFVVDGEDLNYLKR